jgi:D-Tyr-tRNAtyr deacylase
MIDVSKIRSLKMLESIKADLKEFLTHPDMERAYIEVFDWSKDDYEADKEQVEELLKKVERRIVSLSNFLNGTSKKRGSRPSPKQAQSATPSAQ